MIQERREAAFTRGRLRRSTPAHVGKSGEVAVERDELAAVFHRDRRDVRIRREVARCVGGSAECLEELEVALAGRQRYMPRLCADGPEEREGVVDRCRYAEDAPARRDPDEGCPEGVRHGEGLLGREHPIEPWSDECVMRVVIAMRGEKHIHVDKDHLMRSIGRPSSRASRSARFDAASIPGRTPPEP